MSGGNSNNNPCDVTRSEVKKEYKCGIGKSCLKCSKKRNCQKEVARNYRTFDKQKRTELKKRYSCPIRRIMCTRSCQDYEKCNREVKKNHEEWFVAYYKGNKEILEKISKQYRGDFDGRIIN